MAARIIVHLSDGKIVLFGGAPEAGAADAGISDGLTQGQAPTS